jgi:hypothetical protein
VDLFGQRAHAILETAQIGTSDNVTVIFQHDGGLHLVMSDNPAELSCSNAPLDVTYQMMRKGGKIFVIGRDGKQKCCLDAPASPRPAALLLNDQPLYQLASEMRICA